MPFSMHKSNISKIVKNKLGNGVTSQRTQLYKCNTYRGKTCRSELHINKIHFATLALLIHALRSTITEKEQNHTLTNHVRFNLNNVTRKETYPCRDKDIREKYGSVNTNALSSKERSCIRYVDPVLPVDRIAIWRAVDAKEDQLFNVTQVKRCFHLLFFHKKKKSSSKARGKEGRW
jgi:hypothetical protein